MLPRRNITCRLISDPNQTKHQVRDNPTHPDQVKLVKVWCVGWLLIAFSLSDFYTPH